MKLYTYCSQTLSFKQTKLRPGLFSLIITVFAFTIGFGIRHLTDTNPIEHMEEEEMVVVVNNNINDKFEPHKLYDYLKELNVAYPDIVFAQAVLETGNFKSGIFIANHNCFGMKLSSKRPSTAKGLENDHAYYDNWRESAQDYAFYQASYLRNLDREGYMAFIEANYSTTPGYMNRVNQVISNLDKHLYPNGIETADKESEISTVNLAKLKY